MTKPAVAEAVDAFFATARRVLGERGVARDSLALLGEELGQLAAVVYAEDEPAAADASPSRVLRTDPDGWTLVKVRFTAPREPAPVHEHRAWYVLRVINGRERYTEYERLDDGMREGYAELRKGPTRLLAPGDVLMTTGPVIHLHEDYQGETVDELMLLGENPGQSPFRRFDPEARTTFVSEPRKYG